ncbi:MAG: hypothetical protein ACFFC7_19530 [Candidatus Hermodarchaeota archaeon]
MPRNDSYAGYKHPSRTLALVSRYRDLNGTPLFTGRTHLRSFTRLRNASSLEERTYSLKRLSLSNEHQGELSIEVLNILTNIVVANVPSANWN